MNDSYNAIFKSAPVIAVGFIIANFLGELTNSFTVAKMKLITGDRYQSLRLVLSTLLGQSIDNSIAFFTAFYFAGWYSFSEIIPLISSTVIFCTLWEILVLPITHRVIKIVKEKEGLDTYDHGTNFNPFKM
jgi:uncharacterized PurR-regulated membrane protein YhhQ (DUF165 family)